MYMYIGPWHAQWLTLLEYADGWFVLQMFAGKKRLTVTDAMARKKGNFIEKAMFNANTGLRVTTRCNAV